MSQGLTGAVTGAATRQANTASTANMTLPAAPMVATYPITGTTTITSITAGQSGKVALLEFASTNCRVVMGGNLLINGDYLSTAGGFLVLVANGSNWEEVDRTTTVIQPYNAVPNGGFEGWQRPFTTGTQFTSPTNNTQTADRWYWNTGATGGVMNVLQDTSVPAVAYNMIGTPYSAKINVTTADNSLTASKLYAYYTVIEGFDGRALANGFAASWWAKAHRTGTYCVSFANRAFNRSYIVEYNIAVADTWQYFTAVVPAPTGVWTYDATIGMYCLFTLAANTSWGSGASANTWLATTQYSTANQVNGVGATTDTFSIFGLNVVPGTVPQPYNPMPIDLHFQRLLRYYEKWGPTAVTPQFNGYNLTGVAEVFTLPIHPKVVTPTVTIGGTFSVGNCTLSAVDTTTNNMIRVVITVTATGNYAVNSNNSGYFAIEANPA